MELDISEKMKGQLSLFLRLSACPVNKILSYVVHEKCVYTMHMGAVMYVLS